MIFCVMRSLFIIVLSLFYIWPSFAGAENVNEFSWPGSYLGGYSGGAGARSELNTYTGTVLANSYFSSMQDIDAVNQSGTGTLSSGIGLGGVQLGHDWQSHSFVYGVVMDYGSFNFNNSKSFIDAAYPPPSDSTYSLQTSVNSNWLMTARGRLGLTKPHAWWPLAYITGGAALTRFHVSNSFTDYAGLLEDHGLGVDEGFALGQGGASNTVTKLGWTLGAGVDYPLTKHMVVGAEYLFVDFGSVSANSEISTPLIPGYASPFSTKANLTAQLFKLMISYKF